MPSALRKHRDLAELPRIRLLEDALGAAAVPLGVRKATVSSQTSKHLARYQRDPIAWMVERIGIPEHTLRWSLNEGYTTHHWDGDPDPLVRICEALAAGKDVGVESATGTQKTYTAALLVFWFLDCFEQSTVVTGAPREKQLTLHLWKEIGKLWPRFHAIRPEADPGTLRIRMVPGSDVWSAQGFATGVGADEESATRAQGFHAEHMLIITEETPGIDDAILTAFDNTCTAPHNLQLRLGNPDHQLDPLHRFCQRPGVVAVRMSSLDHPNVVANNPSIVPGACSRQKNAERLAIFGEDNPLYQSRTRGISPSQAVDALIRLEWLLTAVNLSRAEKDRRAVGPEALGCDVANSESGDRGSVARGTGALLKSVQSWPCPDANAFARTHVAAEIGPRLAATRCGIDSVGVGAGAVNECTRLKHAVQALNSGSGPKVMYEQEELFANLRSQMHWTFRQELFHGEIAIEERDEEVFADLTTPKWGTRNGKIFIESKEDLKKRLPGGRSPEKGDAVVYWNWVRKDRSGPRDLTFRPARASA